MKSNMTKQVVALLMILALVLSACSSGKDSSNTTTTKNDAVEPKTEVSDQAAPAPVEKVKITYWHNYGADKETPYFQDVIIPMFNEKYPNTEVEVIAQGTDQYNEQIIISAGTNTTPDVARLDITAVAGLAQMGALMPLDNMEGFSTLKDAVFAGPLSANLYKDQYYALPLDTNCKAAVFNMERLKAMGFNEVPKTMEEFIEASKVDGKYTINVSSAGEWDFMPYFWLFGGVLTDEGYTKASGYLDGQESIDAMNEIAKLHDEGVFTIKEIDGSVDAWDGIKTGEYATFLEGPWFFAFTADWKELGLQPALIPTYKGKSASVIGGESIGIFSTSKHPKEAFEFAQFLLSDEVQVLMGSEMGQMPVLKTAAENAKFNENEVWSVYLEQLKSSNTRIPSPNSPDIQTYLKDAFDAILSGDMKTEEALHEAALLIDETLSK